MKKVLVTAKLLAPVAIKRDRQSERSESVRSLTGTSVRGALASVYLQQHGEADDTFKHLFLDEDACRFGPLDPGPKIFPLTAASCKREGIEHDLVDQLWYRIAQHHTEGNLPENVEAAWRQCGNCKEDLKGHHGFWHENNGRLSENTSKHHVAAHVGIDRHTNTAAHAILYTLEALLPSGQDKDLSGWVMVDNNALTTLKTLLEAEDYCISIGHHRTRGYGDVCLQLVEPIDIKNSTDEENWEQWSSELVAFLRQLSIPECPPDDFYFSLSFPTGAVLVDRFLRHTIDPACMIPWLPAMPSVDDAFPMTARPADQLSTGGTLHWVTAVTKHERLRGWNAAHGLPRQDEWMVARGAVYVYCFKGTPEERAALIEQLKTVSKEGVGLRRNEGFGTVLVCDDFHRQYANQQEVQSVTALSNKLIQKADSYIDNKRETFSELGDCFFEVFGYDKTNNRINTQIRNLQQITCSATRFADIEDFVKNQMGKEDKNKPQWRQLGNNVLKGLKELRDTSQELVPDDSTDQSKLSETRMKQMALRLRLARGWGRAVVSQYLYRVAHDQMEGTS